MPDDDGFDKAFEGFGEDEQPTTPPATPPVDPPKDDPAAVEVPKTPEDPNNEPKAPEGEEVTSPPADAKKEEEGAQPPKAPETPPAEEVKPLTRDDLREIINDVRTEERVSGKELETTTNEILEAYYPDGLSNTLVDQNTGKELRTPQDVVDASGGQMSTEEAAQWLLNEQYKLDQDVAKIKNDAQKIAETTVKFKQDGVAVLQRYEPLFKAYPQLQGKVWDQFKKLVKADEAKGVILSAPDMQEFYDTVLEPYQMAYEYGKGQPATNPPAQAPPATPSADDRLDEGGDGGASPVDDPNDFAQQVKKELAKGI